MTDQTVPRRPPRPAGIRASDHDREQLIHRLQAAVDAGRLTLADFDERAAMATLPCRKPTWPFSNKTFREASPTPEAPSTGPQ
jgi:hypothetical protein